MLGNIDGWAPDRKDDCPGGYVTDHSADRKSTRHVPNRAKWPTTI